MYAFPLWVISLHAVVFSAHAQDGNLSAEKQLYNQAATAMNAGHPTECLHILRTVDPEHLKTELFLGLGYICAVSASQLEASDALRKELGLHYLPPSAMDIHHAWMLRGQQKYKEALAVLIPEGWQTPKHKELGTTMQAILYADLEKWTESWILAGSPFVDKNAQLYIAQQLRSHGETTKAAALYDLACTGMDKKQAESKGCASIIQIPTKTK
jgi:hypothetical protein